MKTTNSTNQSEALAPANVGPSASINKSPFDEVTYAYTRKQAVADDLQLEVTQMVREAGIRFPVYLTRAVYYAYAVVPEGLTCQNEAGRLFMEGILAVDGGEISVVPSGQNICVHDTRPDTGVSG